MVDVWSDGFNQDCGPASRRTPQSSCQSPQSPSTPVSPSLPSPNHKNGRHHGFNGYQPRQATVGWGGQPMGPYTNGPMPGFGRQGERFMGRGRGRACAPGGGRMERRHAQRSGTEGSFLEVTVEDLLWQIKRLAPSDNLVAAIADSLALVDSRGTAALLKELAKAGMSKRSAEIFDWLRSLPKDHQLAHLCDVYTYTASISNCVAQQQLDRALDLATEMQARSIDRNVHTFSALMNVCIKCRQLNLAIDVWHDMQRSGVAANVVTYNTLIDVYGKVGRWEEALKVLDRMKAEGIEPVTRTYNTLMIACNTSGQWQEALRMFDEMSLARHSVNTTTYNALISAHSKAGNLPQVLATFHRMVHQGCERSVITYSSLISACEKAGEWGLALQLFDKMALERIRPNVITFNSLITACAQGAQWEKASEIFDQMQGHGCSPDVVTYTALISAFERGGQWRRALQAFEAMTSGGGCAPDAIVYNAIIDALWETGMAWAQRRASGLFRAAASSGLLRRTAHAAGDSLELCLHTLTAGVAGLSLHFWLLDLRATVATEGRGALPEHVAIVTGKGKGKEAGASMVREAVTALLNRRRSPFQECADIAAYGGRLEASGPAVAEWLLSPDAAGGLLPDLDTPSSPSPGAGLASGQTQGPGSPLAPQAASPHAADLRAEAETEARCMKAFAAVRYFEDTHRLNLQAMGYSYLQQRGEIVATLLRTVKALNIQAAVAYDAALLLDRAMSVAGALGEGCLPLAAAACLLLVLRAEPASAAGTASPRTATHVAHVTGYAEAVVTGMEAEIAGALGHDTAAISMLRCLLLFLDRLGTPATAALSPDVGGDAVRAAAAAAAEPDFLNFRPSVAAAALLYVDRRSRGALPFWPSALATLTGYAHAHTPELNAAIAAVQRMAERMGSAAPLRVAVPSWPCSPRGGGGGNALRARSPRVAPLDAPGATHHGGTPMAPLRAAPVYAPHGHAFPDAGACCSPHLGGVAGLGTLEEDSPHLEPLTPLGGNAPGGFRGAFLPYSEGSPQAAYLRCLPGAGYLPLAEGAASPHTPVVGATVHGAGFRSGPGAGPAPLLGIPGVGRSASAPAQLHSPACLGALLAEWKRSGGGGGAGPALDGSADSFPRTDSAASSAHLLDLLYLEQQAVPS